MRTKITNRLKQIGQGYDLDKLPPALLEAIITAATPLIADELKKAENQAIHKVVNERFVAKAIKSALERKPRRRSQTPPEKATVPA